METHHSENERLRQLRELEILDSEAEPEFDDLVSLAAAVCGVPVSMISLIDGERQWFKAAKGVTVRETPRSVAFCDHTIRQSELFLVEDTRVDNRFAQNPTVTGGPQWRFYAGFPLRIADGLALGTLCVLDYSPRVLSEQQRSALRVLADQVMARLELRSKRRELELALQEKASAHAESQRMEQRFERFMDSGPFVSYMKDAEGRMIYYNRPLAQRFNVTRQEMLGKTDAELWPADVAANFRAHDLAVLQGGALTVTRERTRNEDGTETIWQSYKFPCTSADGETLLGGVSVDVTEQLAREDELVRVQKELQQANMLLAELAAKDALTGLAVRRLFDERLRIAFREARKGSRPLCLLMLDIDNFKLQNDTFGHQHGDSVLKMVADCLMAQLRPTDFIARYGGEEFAIICPDTGLEGATLLARRLVKAVQQNCAGEQGVTISIGVSEMQEGLSTTDDLIAEADGALFLSKREGKNRVSCWRGESAIAADAQSMGTMAKQGETGVMRMRAGS